MISTVTFDCWSTLINDRRMEGHAAVRVAALCAATSEKLAEEEAHDLLDRAWRTHHTAWVSGEQFGSVGMAAICAQELNLDEAAKAKLCEAFEGAAREGDVNALPGAVDSLKLLKDAGIATALVCDTGFTPGRIVRDFLDMTGLLAHLDFCAFSDEVGYPKPNREIFAAALDAVGGRPDRSVHVGDLIRTDVAGGRGAGMSTVRITAVHDDSVSGYSWGGTLPEESLEDAHEIVGSHYELPDALKRLGAEI